MIDPSERRFRELLETMLPHADTARLMDAPRVAGPPALRAIFARGVAMATRFGRHLPARLHLDFIDVPETSFGLTQIRATGEVEVLLNVAMPRGEWVRVCLHELQHVADAGLELPAAEREMRAIDFSEAVLRWHWPREPWLW